MTAARRDDLLLAARKLEVGFGKTAILPPIDFEVRRGELWGVIGRNGAGKTTLFRTLLGLHPPVSGRIEKTDGTVLGYVPQRHSIDPLVPARAIDLIAEGVDEGFSFVRPFLRKTDRDRIDRAVDMTGSAPLLRRRYRDLSEGERQRVLLARAVAGSADLLVLDEPTSAMDVVAERQVVAILEQLRDRLQLGILLVSHHIGLLLSIVDRILYLDSDDRMALCGPAHEIMNHPLFVAKYGASLPSHPMTIPKAHEAASGAG